MAAKLTGEARGKRCGVAGLARCGGRDAIRQKLSIQNFTEAFGF